MIFSVNKFLPFLVGFFKIVEMNKLKTIMTTSKRSIFELILRRLDCIDMKMAEIWFGISTLIYLNVFDSSEN